MTTPIVITHAKVSTVPVDQAAQAQGKVTPDDWNENHVITGLEESLNLITPFLLMGA